MFVLLFEESLRPIIFSNTNDVIAKEVLRRYSPQDEQHAKKTAGLFILFY